MRRNLSISAKKPLKVLKFGGTSVGNAAAIRRVIDIIREARCESDLVIVVSAMSGVTNQLLEAAAYASQGNCDSVGAIFERLRAQHRAVIAALIHSVPARSRIVLALEEVFQQGECLCQETARLRELSLCTRDSIASLGERLSAPLVAAVLAESGIVSQAVEATELIQTNNCYGSADPHMDATRQRCQARLAPLLLDGITPVVTGFLGATAEGVRTTLGRGGSDYSATILGAALDAREITIWTDVDGLMTADPRLVPEAVTIEEISYREAAELAHFGAKVLHPKTLSPVIACGIPLWIGNTFAPEKPGTRITSAGLNEDEPKSLTSMSEVALITLSGAKIADAASLLDRSRAIVAAIPTEVLLTSQLPSANQIGLVIPSSVAERVLEALRREFAPELAGGKLDQIALDPTIATITLVGKNIREGVTIGHALAALARERVKTTVIADAVSDCNISFVVAKHDVPAALSALHHEFELGVAQSQPFAASLTVSTAVWPHDSAQQTAAAD